MVATGAFCVLTMLLGILMCALNMNMKPDNALLTDAASHLGHKYGRGFFFFIFKPNTLD